MAQVNNATILDISNKMSLSVTSTTNTKNYFEEPFRWRPQLNSTDVLVEFVPQADTPSEADANVIAHPSVLEKLVDYEVTEIPASNGQGYALYASAGDPTSAKLNNFLTPQIFGNGYAFTLKQADDTVINLTDGAYQFDYANGVIRFDPDNRPVDLGYALPMKLTVYRYIGFTLSGIIGFSGAASIIQEERIRVFDSSSLAVSPTQIRPGRLRAIEFAPSVDQAADFQFT